MSATVLSRLQMGAETSAGTIHAATSRWRGNGKFTDDQIIKDRDDNVGIGVQIDSSYIPSKGATMNLSSRIATFEQLPYMFEMGCGAVAPTGQGDITPTSYKQIYTPDVTADGPTPATYTFEGGDAQQGYVFNYCFIKELKLSGVPQEAVKMEATLGAQYIAKQAFTAGLALPTEEEIEFQKGKIYMDAVGITQPIGHTPLTNTWLGFDLDFKPGLFELFTGDGNLGFSKPAYAKATLSGSFTIMHDSFGVAAYDDFVAITNQKLRMEFKGSPFVGTGGSPTFATKIFRVDACAMIKKITLLDTYKGRNTVKVEWDGEYHTGTTGNDVSLWCNFSAAHLLSALP